jgi:hypothetical protein
MTNQDGSCFQAGVEVGSGSVRAAWVTGRWVAAINAACSGDTSAQNCWWNRSCRMASSGPPPGTGYAFSASPKVLPGNLPDRSKAFSPWSGANASTYTSALTSSLSEAASVMTNPP